MSSPEVFKKKSNDSNSLNEYEVSRTSNNKSKQEVPPRYRNKEQDFEPEIKNIDKYFDEVLITIEGVPGRIQYFPNYISSEEADSLYKYLTEHINWKQREGTNQNGDTYYEPRLTYWFGKPYTYSKVKWESNQNWDKEIDKLRVRLTKEHPIDDQKEYNSVMCNYYRNNIDSIGWHSDDEMSLGRFPKIASISLGCQRVFEVCRREEYYSRGFYDGPRNSVFSGCTILYRFHLKPGSLLIMEGSIQEEFLHRVPKENSPMKGRINLTYRYIVSEEVEKLEKERRLKIRKQQYKQAGNRSNKTYQDGTNLKGINQQHKVEKKDPVGKADGNRNVIHMSEWNSKYCNWNGQQDKQYNNERSRYYDNEIRNLKNKGIRSTEDYKKPKSNSYNESGQVNSNDTSNKNNKRNKLDDLAESDYLRFSNTYNVNKKKNQSANSKEFKRSTNKCSNMHKKPTQNFEQRNEILNNKNKKPEENQKEFNTAGENNEMKTENKHEKNENWSDFPIDDKVLLTPEHFSESKIQEKNVCSKNSSLIAGAHEMKDNGTKSTDNLPQSITEKTDVDYEKH